MASIRCCSLTSTLVDKNLSSLALYYVVHMLEGERSNIGHFLFLLIQYSGNSFALFHSKVHY